MQIIHLLIATASLLYIQCAKSLQDKRFIASTFFDPVDQDGGSYRIGNTRYDTRTGVPISIYNVGYIAHGESHEEMADDFLSNNKILLGANESSEKETWEITSSRKTGVWTTVRYRQLFDNIPVYDSDLVITINESNVVRMVTSKYKKGVYLDPNNISYKYSDNRILDAAVQKYGKGSYDNFKHYTTEKVIYHKEGGVSVLAWKVNFATNGNFTENEIVYDDRTADVILEVDQTLDKTGIRAKKQPDISRKLGTIPKLSQDSSRERRLEDSMNSLADFLESESVQAFIQLLFEYITLAFEWLISDNETSAPFLVTAPSPEVVPTPLPSIFPTFDPIQRGEPVGFVFDPDPLSTANALYDCDEGFCDNNDSNSEQIDEQLKEVTLRDLTQSNGRYQLKGPFAQVIDTHEPFHGLFEKEVNDFRYKRNHPGFEAVNAYYHIDQMMRYINDELNIFVFPFQYSGGVRYDPHGTIEDNSFYNRGTGTLNFGVGGVDDAEDADVIIHELGHGIHDWVTGGQISREEGLSEGFGDYITASYSRSKGHWTVFDEQYHWIFNWDGHNEFSDGRVTFSNKQYPEGILDGDQFIYENGKLWASCNMKIWDQIGREHSDMAHIIGLASTGSASNQEDLANAIYLAASDLNFPTTEIQQIREIYVAHGYRVSDGLCGDGVLNEFEECDAFDIGNATCLNVGCSGGIPSCTNNCILDYSSCEVGVEDDTFELEITFDLYANETSWELIRESDGTILRSGGDDAEYSHLTDLTTVVGSGCLAPNECFVLTIYDAFGDGLCCSFGEGDYNVYINGAPLENTNPSFGESVSHYIGVNCPPLNRCGDGVRGAFEACDGADFGNAVCAESGCSGGFLKCTNQCEIDYSDCVADDSELAVDVSITFDNFAWETSWKVASLSDLVLIESGGLDGEYDHLYGQTITESFCLTADLCYEFKIEDEYGDGICCSNGVGGYDVIINGEPLATNSAFDFFQIHYFGFECPPEV